MHDANLVQEPQLCQGRSLQAWDRHDLGCLALHCLDTLKLLCAVAWCGRSLENRNDSQMNRCLNKSTTIQIIKCKP